MLYRGHWIYQAPRILVILAYLYAQGVDVQKAREIIKKHTEYVRRLSASKEKWWIVERLEQLGYECKRPWAKSAETLVKPEYIEYYLQRLGLNGSHLMNLVEIVSSLLKLLKAHDEITSVAFLPPLITVPEKLILLNSISRSEPFDLRTSLDVVIDSWIRGVDPVMVLEGEVNEKKKQFRFRFAYMVALGLVAGSRSRPKPTLLGLIAREAMDRGKDPVRAYARALVDYGKIEALMLLDLMALDVVVRNMLDKYVELVSNTVSKYLGSEVDARQLATMLSKYVTRLPLDVRGYSAIVIQKRIDSILQIVET